MRSGDGVQRWEVVPWPGGSALKTLACWLSHGAAGAAKGPNTCASGVEGMDVDLVGHSRLARGNRALPRRDVAIVEGVVTTLTLVGVPGDLAFANVALKPEFLLTSSTQCLMVFLGAIPRRAGRSRSPCRRCRAAASTRSSSHLQSGWFTSVGEIRLGSNASVVLEK